jgi:hypothetical protein
MSSRRGASKRGVATPAKAGSTAVKGRVKRKPKTKAPFAPTFTVFVSGYDPLAQPLWKKPKQLCCACTAIALLLALSAVLVRNGVLPEPGVVAMGAVTHTQRFFGGRAFAASARNLTLAGARRSNATALLTEYGEDYGQGGDYYESGARAGANATDDDDEYYAEDVDQAADPGANSMEAYAAYDGDAWAGDRGAGAAAHSRHGGAPLPGATALTLEQLQTILAAAGGIGGRYGAPRSRSGAAARRADVSLRGGARARTRRSRGAGGRGAKTMATKFLAASDRHAREAWNARRGAKTMATKFLAASDRHAREAWNARRRRKSRSGAAAGPQAQSRQKKRARRGVVRSGALGAAPLPAAAVPRTAAGGDEGYGDPGYER